MFSAKKTYPSVRLHNQLAYRTEYQKTPKTDKKKWESPTQTSNIHQHINHIYIYVDIIYIYIYPHDIQNSIPTIYAPLFFFFSERFGGGPNPPFSNGRARTSASSRAGPLRSSPPRRLRNFGSSAPSTWGDQWDMMGCIYIYIYIYITFI